MNKVSFVILILGAFLGISGGAYFFVQKQSLENQVSILQGAKSKVETELAVLKSTDLAKENELLKVKSESMEKELTSERNKAQSLESNLGEAQDKVKSLESKISEAKPYFAVLGAFYDWEYKPSQFPLLDRNTSAIDSAIAALKDSQVSNLWSSIKANFQRDKQTGFSNYGEVLNLMNYKIADLLK